jgi:hypothetical protein
MFCKVFDLIELVLLLQHARALGCQLLVASSQVYAVKTTYSSAYGRGAGSAQIDVQLAVFGERANIAV